jgi:hypothetical protein
VEAPAPNDEALPGVLHKIIISRMMKWEGIRPRRLREARREPRSLSGP